MEKLQALNILRFVLDNTNPWIGVISFFVLLFSFYQSFFCNVLSRKFEKTGLDFFLEYIRQRFFLAAIFVHFLVLCFLFFVSSEKNIPGNIYITALWAEYKNSWVNFWWLYLASFFVFVFTTFLYHRYFKSWLNHLIRSLHVTQSEDKISNIKEEFDKTKSMSFDPTTFYKPGYFFFGLDQENKPILIKDDHFKKRHSKIIGPTQSGKGVGIGVVLDQAIKKGWGVWFIDIKPDDFIYQIMKQACEKSGRELNFLDLNGSFGSYEPFKNGTDRDREERVVKACRIADTGTNADFYNIGNRTVLSMLMGQWDGTIENLSELLSLEKGVFSKEEKIFIKERGINLKDRIMEFKKLGCINQSKNKQQNQFIVKDALQNGDVVIIEGNMKDKLVRNLNISLIEELVQEVLKNPQKKHTLVVIDEVRFLVSDTLADSMATLLSKNVNIAVTYQARRDLLNLTDKTLNALSIANGIETNTLLTIGYRGNDEETARWLAGMTGTETKIIKSGERVEVSKVASEEWTGEKTYSQSEEFVVTTNQILAFPEKVGIFLNSGSLAKIIKTHWVTIKRPYKKPVRDDYQIDNNIYIPSEKKGSKNEQKKKSASLMMKELKKNIKNEK